MRVRDFYAFEADDIDFFWKYQLVLGLLLVLLGVCIVLFPPLLAVMVAAAIIVAGVTIIGSALRFRKLYRRCRDFAMIDVFEW